MGMSLKNQQKQLDKWKSERNREARKKRSSEKTISRLTRKIDSLQDKMPLPEKFINQYLKKHFKVECHMLVPERSVVKYIFITKVVNRLKMRGNVIIFSTGNNTKKETIEIVTDTEILSNDLYQPISKEGYDAATDKVQKSVSEIFAYKKIPPYSPPEKSYTFTRIADTQLQMADKINLSGGNMLNRALNQSSPKNLTQKRKTKKTKRNI